MFREIITPTQSDFTIHLPNELVGKEVEIIAFEIGQMDEDVKRKKAFEKALAFWDANQVDLSNFKFDRDEANER